MADFEKEKIRERNRGKITDFGRENWRRPVIGKLDLLFFYVLAEIQKLC